MTEPVYKGKVFAKEGVVVLREVARRNGRSPFDLAGLDVFRILDGFEECGLENAVIADESDLVIAAEGEVQMLELCSVAGIDRQILDFENDLARFTVHLEADPRELTARCRHFIDGHFVKKLFTACGLLCLGSV